MEGFAPVSTYTAAPVMAPFPEVVAAPAPLPTFAAAPFAPPAVEAMAPPVNLDGSPVELVLQGERKDSEYEWFRYSKCAFPFLLLLLFLAGVSFTLTVWQGNMTLKRISPGTPMEFNPKDVDYPGDTARTFRIVATFFALAAVAVVLLVVYLRPAPGARKGAYGLGIFFFIVTIIFAALALSKDWKEANNQFIDEEIMGATAVVDAVLIFMALVTALSLALAVVKMGKESDMADFDAAFATPVKKGVGRATRNLVVFFLVLTALTAITLMILTIWIEERRPEASTLDDVFGVAKYSNLQPGWAVKNTRLRLAAAASLIILIIVTLIPFRSRVIAYVLGFLILLTVPLYVFAFSLDVSHLIAAKDFDCPRNWDCSQTRFVATVVFDFIIPIVTLLYVFSEFLVRWATNATGPSRVLY